MCIALLGHDHSNGYFSKNGEWGSHESTASDLFIYTPDMIRTILKMEAKQLEEGVFSRRWELRIVEYQTDTLYIMDR